MKRTLSRWSVSIQSSFGMASTGVLWGTVFSALSAQAADRPHYHLFNRAPEAELRELSTDRPDKTESPISVDPGYFQIESSLMTLARTADSLELGEVNLKAGLTPSSDLQVIFVPYIDSGDSTGFSDVLLRLKWNITGNDGGDLALALMPYVNLPVGKEGFSSDHTDFGLIVPMDLDLPGGFSLGAMAQLDVLKDSNDLSTMVTLGHDLVGDLAGYVEFFNTLGDFKTEGWVATLDVGLTYGLTPNLQLDAGMNIGLTDAAESLETFAGVSIRL